MPFCCPIALALKRVNTINIIAVCRYKLVTKDYISVLIPDRHPCQEFIKNFDRSIQVSPFSFEIDLDKMVVI